MFRQLFERLPDIAASGEPDRLRSSFINGIKHLECTFTPARSAPDRAVRAVAQVGGSANSSYAARRAAPTPVPAPHSS